MTTQPELPFMPEQKEAVFGSAWGLEETAASLGIQLRDAALAQSQQGREERIEQVRLWLIEQRHLSIPFTLNADNVQDAVDELFGAEMMERRWTASVLVGWSAVSCTDHFVTSRRARNHGRKIPLWRWR